MLRCITVGSFVLNFVVTFFLLLRPYKRLGKGIVVFCLLGCLSFVDIFSSLCFCLLIAKVCNCVDRYRTGSSVRASATGNNSVVELVPCGFLMSFCSFRDVRFFACTSVSVHFMKMKFRPCFNICMRVYRQPIRVK